MPLGFYISVPFCRTKCSYCNFASDVFARGMVASYVDRVCADIARAERVAAEVGGELERAVDSVYLGGGTPTTLEAQQLKRMFATIGREFQLQPGTEITVECAPGSLTPEMLEALVRCGVSRVSLGVQSFVDAEAAAVGRRHTRAVILDDISRLRAAGITNLNLDLIAGLPHQTAESWRRSLEETIASGVSHVSVYMLEVDEDSRLGRELIAGGTRYHAHFVPNEDATADFYLQACAQLETAGIRQYEISNFARDGMESRHNLKYWTRQPYLGFGLDAHSMLKASRSSALPAAELESVRFSTPDTLEAFNAGTGVAPKLVSQRAALEETFFLGLRLNRGVDLCQVGAQFGQAARARFAEVIRELSHHGLLETDGDLIRLTPRGRLLSNEVFERFIAARRGPWFPAAAPTTSARR